MANNDLKTGLGRRPKLFETHSYNVNLRMSLFTTLYNHRFHNSVPETATISNYQFV